MPKYARSITFDILNQSGTQTWAEVYAYESISDPGALTFEFTPADYSSSNGSKAESFRKSFRLFLNTIQNLSDSKNLEFIGLSSLSAGNRDSPYAFNYSGDSTPIVFTIKSSDGSALTLEDVVSVSTGRGNTATVLPFAPDALDDSYQLFEDGASNSEEPLAEAKPVKLDVLKNDIDANGFKLYISEIIEGPQEGTVTIEDSDGDGYGDHLLYTPTSDKEFNASITYYVSNFNGGTDLATASISVAAVADQPIVSTSVFAGDSPNKTVIRVSASPDDADNSETITSIALASDLLPGVTVTKESALLRMADSNTWYKDFEISTNGPNSINLDFIATSTETSNGDTETTVATQSIEVFEQKETLEQGFVAKDQNMWATGDAYIFEWSDTFILNPFGRLDGKTFSFANASLIEDPILGIDIVEWDFDVQFSLGFRPYIYLNAGSVDASSMFTIEWEQIYNQTTDQLQITPTARLDDAAFQTIFANGYFGLDLVYSYYIDALVDNGSLEPDRNSNLIDVFADSGGEQSFNLFEFSTGDINVEIEIPETPITIGVAWPQLEISSDPFAAGTNAVEGTGFSNNFFNLNIDVIQVILDVVKYTTGVEIPSEIFSWETDAFSYNLLGIDLGLGLNVDQAFELSFDGLSGEIFFSDPADAGINSTFDFITGKSLIFDNAMTRFDGDGDGIIEYDFTATPNASLANDTGLGINVNGELSGPGFDIAGIFDWELFDPLEFSENIATIPVLEKEFAYEFDPSDPLQIQSPASELIA